MKVISEVSLFYAKLARVISAASAATPKGTTVDKGGIYSQHASALDRGKLGKLHERRTVYINIVLCFARGLK